MIFWVLQLVAVLLMVSLSRGDSISYLLDCGGMFSVSYSFDLCMMYCGDYG